MPTFEFKPTLRGTGATIDEAWFNAVDTLAEEPGPVPDQPHEYEIVEDEDDPLEAEGQSYDDHADSLLDDELIE